MAHTYTNLQMIRYIFKEMDIFDKFEMEFAMEDDSTLLDEYTQLKEGLSALPQATFSPKKSSIDAILAYSMTV